MLSRKEAFEKFLAHPKHKNIKYSRKDETFKIISLNKRCNGLTKLIKKIRHGWKRTRGGNSSSAFRGKQTDTQLGLYCLNPEIDTKRFNIYTRRVIKYLKSEGIKLVKCQLPIYCSQSGVATAIDMIGWNEQTQTSYMFELKTGHERNMFHSNKQMRHPYQERKNSPFTAAQIQLGAEKVWVEELYNYKFDHYKVIHAMKTDTKIYDLSTWASEPKHFLLTTNPKMIKKKK